MQFRVVVDAQTATLPSCITIRVVCAFAAGRVGGVAMGVCKRLDFFVL